MCLFQNDQAIPEIPHKPFRIGQLGAIFPEFKVQVNGWRLSTRASGPRWLADLAGAD